MTRTAPAQPLAPTQPALAQPAAPAVDYVGMWYVARARYGISDQNWFGFATGDDDAMQWIRKPHREADGIGALTQLLALRGCSGGEMPLTRDPGAPPLWQQLTAPRIRVAAGRRGRIRWRFLDPARAAAAHDAPPAYVFLEDKEYAALRAAASRAGVSTTQWLLWTVDRAARSVLVEQDSPLPWVFPVNLRGAVQAATPTMNHCSGITAWLDGATTAADVAAQVRSRLAAGEHWRQWQLLTLGRLVGQAGVNLLYRLARGRAGACAGSYSNLGRWPLPGMALPAGNDIRGVVCSSPGSPAYPISVGMVEWQGRLSLSCRIHPVAAADAGCADRLLQAWRSRACSG